MDRSKKLEIAHRVEDYDVENVDRPVRDRWISMSNALTRAAHGLSLSEKRVVAIAASKLDSRRDFRVGEVVTTRITAVEYAEFTDCEMPTAYEQLQDAGAALYQRSITFYEPAHKRNGKPLAPTKVQMRWVGSAKYQKGEGWIELAWWPPLLPHLLNLRQRFTSYNLSQTTRLRSVYSWKLLELLMRFKSTGWAEYTIEDFVTSMDATDKQRQNFNNIRRKIIDPAVKELVAKDGWEIQWRPVNAGRRVKAVRFEFKRGAQAMLPL
jgi:plasmid replication initiation protein